MNCEELRAMVGAEPNTTNPDVIAHLTGCAECTRYRQELQAMDGLIYRALAIDVPPEKSASLRSQKQKTTRVWRMAASVLITVLVGLLALWTLTPIDTFAAEAIEHVQDEQFSLVRTTHSVDDQQLEKVLAASRLRLKPGAVQISYAQSCPFRGQVVPHLVVQTAQGPVTALVVTHVPTQRRKHIDEDGFQGDIVPAPRGVIIVLGQNVPVDAVAKTLLSALEY